MCLLNTSAQFEERPFIPRGQRMLDEATRTGRTTASVEGKVLFREARPGTDIGPPNNDALVRAHLLGYALD
jgi:hypothetical protein